MSTFLLVNVNKDCGVLVPHTSEGHGHETHGHKTTTSSGHEEHKGTTAVVVVVVKCSYHVQ